MKKKLQIENIKQKTKHTDQKIFLNLKKKPSSNSPILPRTQKTGNPARTRRIPRTTKRKHNYTIPYYTIAMYRASKKGVANKRGGLNVARRRMTRVISVGSVVRPKGFFIDVIFIAHPVYVVCTRALKCANTYVRLCKQGGSGRLFFFPRITICILCYVFARMGVLHG